MNHTIEHHRRLFMVLSSMGLTDARHELIYDFTNGRTSSTSDMSDTEVNELIAHLENKAGEDYRYGEFDLGNSQHRYIMAMCYEMGWTYYDDSRHKTLADPRKIGKWLLSGKAKVKVPLKLQNKKEMQLTIYQLEQINKSKHTKTETNA